MIDLKDKEKVAIICAGERERCAKIAELVASETVSGEGEIYIARKIANAIRAGKLD